MPAGLPCLLPCFAARRSAMDCALLLKSGFFPVRSVWDWMRAASCCVIFFGLFIWEALSLGDASGPPTIGEAE